MLDELEIRKEIARLEYEESSYPNYAKLATLYAVRAEMHKPERSAEAEIAPHYLRRYSASPAPELSRTVGSYGDSDFLTAISGKTPADVWGIMDELMQSLNVMQPRTYAAVMRKIDAL